jgi:hypothetical protein
MEVADRRQRIGKSARLLKIARQRRFDGSDLFVQLVRRCGTLDPLAFGGEMVFGFRLLLLQHGEGIVDVRQRGRCRVHGSSQLVETVVIIEIAAQERLLKSLGRCVHRLLCSNALGGDLFAALRKRSDGVFNCMGGLHIFGIFRTLPRGGQSDFSKLVR